MNNLNFDEAFKQSPICQLVFDSNYKVVAVSNLFLKRAQHVSEDIVGRNISSIISQTDVQKENRTFLSDINDVLKNKETVTIAPAYYDIGYGKNQNIRCAITLAPLVDNEQKFTFFVLIMEEVLEKENPVHDNLFAADNKLLYLKDNEILCSSILENSPDCIKIIDKKGRIKFMNDRGLCLLEIDEFAEVQNKYWWDLWESDDKPLIKNAVAKSFKKEKVHFQASAKTAKGNLKWWDVIILPMFANDENNTPEQLLTVSRDITDYKNANLKIVESEKNFRQLADMMPSKISNARADGSLIYLNKKWQDYTGKTFAELQGPGYYSILHPDEKEDYTNHLLMGNATGTMFKMEMRILNKQGEYKWHLLLASPIKDEQEITYSWVCNTVEIHEQITQKELLKQAVKERTLELEIANKELVYQNEEKEKRSAELGIANIELALQNTEKEKRTAELNIANVELAYQNIEKEKRSSELTIANKELQSFTYVASHDLQEPLRKIKFFIDRIFETELETLTQTGQDYFRRINNASQRMSQLITDLLSFSKIGVVDREMELTDLYSIVQEVKEELKENIENKHIIIEIKSTCKIKVIKFQFRQLVHNLLGNSIKFTQPGVTPNITISSHMAFGKTLNNIDLVPENIYCHIIITDNGIGFEPEYNKRIFEVFQKLHSKEVYSGTGIGLAIVKKIIDNHNGYITSNSELGRGATFEIYLPV